MADHQFADNFVPNASTDNAAAHAAKLAQTETAHNLLADTFKPAEHKGVSSNIAAIAEGTALTGTGAAVGAGVGLYGTAGMYLLGGIGAPLMGKSIPAGAQLGAEFALKRIMPTTIAVGALAGFGAYELLHHTLLKPSDKK